jgi:hypothetical protein
MVPGHGPGTRPKCFALWATKSTAAEERRFDQPAHAEGYLALTGVL